MRMTQSNKMNLCLAFETKVTNVSLTFRQEKEQTIIFNQLFFISLLAIHLPNVCIQNKM